MPERKCGRRHASECKSTLAGDALMNWKKGTGPLGILQPLIGEWQVFDAQGTTAASGMTCVRTFEVIGSGWVELNARWEKGSQTNYHEVAMFGQVETGLLEFFSFTSDGKRSVGRLCDGIDVHAEAIAFEADMPAGLARMIYWPLANDAPGFHFAAESRTDTGWNRFLSQHYEPLGDI